MPPYKRHVNTVFQDYALFPHMTILDNVAYGLMVKGVDRTTRQKKAEEALSLVALGGYGTRRPGQLSGGQRQRVALARALVNEPACCCSMSRLVPSISNCANRCRWN